MDAVVNLGWLDGIVFTVYLAGIVLLGIIASRRAGSSKRNYFLAGDRLPWWMIGGSIVAANVSSHHFIGVIGTAYARGFAAMTIEWPTILIGFNALLWIFLPFYLRNNFYTMPEFLDQRFGRAARTVFAALILIVYIFVEISAVLYMGAIALETLFGWNLNASIIGLALFTGIYTIAGGLRAVVWTEMFQLVVLLTGGLILSFATIHAVGGWQGVMATSGSWELLLPATDPDFPWTSFLGGILCLSVFYCAANQFIVQRTLAAKDEWHARMGVVFADYLKFFLPLIVVIPGMLAPILFPNLEKPDMAFPTLVGHLLPQGLVGLVMAGLIAAIMSHISGAVNSCTTILTVDFYLPFINPKAEDRQAVLFGRIMGVAIVVMGILWASVLIKSSDRPIFIYLFNAYGYVTPGIATMFLLGVLWKRTTHAGALAAGILTIPLTVALELLTPRLPDALGQYLHPFFNRTGIVFWACMLTGMAVSLVTTPKPEAEICHLIWTRESLRMPPELRARMRGLKNPAFWWALVTAAVGYMYIRYH
ncbi:MAG TPA: sodium/solute symporter [Candidatus Hydrogenedentes bacterium]|nr:sodium/solute symporter [Candidatus Hydrogenedentota bacterium]